MRRTTISLPEAVADALDREARRRGTSLSDVVRAALAAHLKLDAPRHLPFESLGRSGQQHTARDFEQLLEHEWGDALDRHR